jgi:hypothetical protein
MSSDKENEKPDIFEPPLPKKSKERDPDEPQTLWENSTVSAFGKYPLDHFFTNRGVRATNYKRWKVGVYQQSFALKNMKDVHDTHALLNVLFAHFITMAFAAGESEFGPVERFSMVIHSPLLKKGDIRIGLGPRKQNTPEFILNEFERVQQSNGRVDLFGGPLDVSICTVPADADSLEHKGSGPKRKKIEHRIDMRFVTKV